MVARFLSLAIVAAMAFAGGARVFTQTATAHQVVAILFNALGAAALVAVMEEILFRGGMFGGLRKFFYWPLALVASSMIYALAHFLRRAEFAGAVDWYSGLVLLPRLLGGFMDFHALVPDFFNLTLAGVLLGLAYQRTGNLYFSIGLHAGWIFWLKTYGALTVATPRAAAEFWGTGKMIDGWLALMVLVAVFFLLQFCRSAARANPSPFPNDCAGRNLRGVPRHRPGLFLSRNLPALPDETRVARGRLCLCALPVPGPVHPTAVLRTLRPALSRRFHRAV